MFFFIIRNFSNKPEVKVHQYNTVIKIASESEREEIYKIRYRVYALELKQHPENNEKKITDPIDEINTYIVVKINGEISGFVSITNPGDIYGLDKYVSRDEFPFIYDNLYEGRLFTVLKEFRGSSTALLLFFGIFRFAEYYGGTKIMTIGRTVLVDFYKKTGLNDLGRSIKSGEVEFKLMYAEISEIRNNIMLFERMLSRIINYHFH